MKKYAVALIADEENLTLNDELYQKEVEKAAAENGFRNPADYDNAYQIL